MGFLKKRREVLLIVAFCFFIVLQQMAVRYRMTRSATEEVTGKDTLASFEINQLEQLWIKADVDNLLTLEKISNPEQLEQARIRLKLAERGIRESKNRVQGVTGKSYEFFQKAHAYYLHSVSALVGIVDFLLANEGKYSIIENKHEISFVSDSDAVSFQELIGKLSDIHQEKEELDAFILNHNRELLAR